MFRLSCPRCGASPKKARLQVTSGTFGASGMYLEEGGFDFTESVSIDTENEMVWCQACDAIMPLDECYSSSPKPSFRPFKGFDWSELAERFGVELDKGFPYDGAPLEKYIQDHCNWFAKDSPHLLRERSRVCKTCREFLAALIENNPTYYLPLWRGLAKMRHDQTFIGAFITLLPTMWY